MLWNKLKKFFPLDITLNEVDKWTVSNKFRGFNAMIYDVRKEKIKSIIQN